jgi:single-stranded DNA-binding protein
MNQVTLIGNLTKDLESKEFSGTKVYSGTLAVARSYTKENTLPKSMLDKSSFWAVKK